MRARSIPARGYPEQVSNRGHGFRGLPRHDDRRRLTLVSLSVACLVACTPEPIVTAPPASIASTTPTGVPADAPGDEGGVLADAWIADAADGADPARADGGRLVIVKLRRDPCAGGASVCADAKKTVTCVRQLAAPPRVRYEPPYERCNPSTEFSKRATDDARTAAPWQCCYLRAAVQLGLL